MTQYKSVPEMLRAEGCDDELITGLEKIVESRKLITALIALRIKYDIATGDVAAACGRSLILIEHVEEVGIDDDLFPAVIAGYVKCALNAESQT